MSQKGSIACGFLGKKQGRKPCLNTSIKKEVSSHLCSFFQKKKQVNLFRVEESHVLNSISCVDEPDSRSYRVYSLDTLFSMLGLNHGQVPLRFALKTSCGKLSILFQLNVEDFPCSEHGQSIDPVIGRVEVFDEIIELNQSFSVVLRKNLDVYVVGKGGVAITLNKLVQCFWTDHFRAGFIKGHYRDEGMRLSYSAYPHWAGWYTENIRYLPVLRMCNIYGTLTSAQFRRGMGISNGHYQMGRSRPIGKSDKSNLLERGEGRVLLCPDAHEKMKVKPFDSRLKAKFKKRVEEFKQIKSHLN